MKTIPLLLLFWLNIKLALTSKSRSRRFFDIDETPTTKTKISSRTKVEILSKPKKTTSVLIKVKPKKSIPSVLSNKIDLKLKRSNIISMEITKDDYYILVNDTNVELITLNHEAFIVDAPQGRNLEEAVDWGVTEVLQDLTFWESLPTPNSEMKICVCDTGYNLGHSDLPSGTDVTGFNNPSVDEDWSYDGNGHGTHVAGIIAALANDIGTRGVISDNKGGKFQLIIAKTFSASGLGDVASILYSVEECVAQGMFYIFINLAFIKFV